MASKQRSRAPRKPQAPNQLLDLGLFDIPDLDVMDNEEDDEVDESALESELEALLTGKTPNKLRPKQKVASPVDFESMVATCMKDVEEEEDENDESLLTDPDLLKELQGLSCDKPQEDDDLTQIFPNKGESDIDIPQNIQPAVIREKSSENISTLLEDRLQLYNEALAAAKEMGDNSKVRRYGRAIKTLESLLKSAKSGRNVNEEDIPPVVNIPKRKPEAPPEPKLPPEKHTIEDIPVPPAESKSDNNKDNLISIPSNAEEAEMSPDCHNLIMRRDQYRIVALQAKRAGDKTAALQYLKIAKGIDGVIIAVKNGESVDLSSIPPPPPAYHAITSTAPNPSKTEVNEMQTSSIEAAALSAASEPEDPAMFAAPPPPKTVLDALQQRLEKYTSTKAAAETEGNNSKVRRLQRIIKSYEKAIKDYKAGKPVDFEELPTPPGFAPIPVPSQPDALPASPSNRNVAISKDNTSSEAKPAVIPPKQVAPSVPTKPKVQRTNTSTVDKQLEFLLERQKLFRQAALAAKKNGNIQQAKEYLRLSKGFDSMIEATKCGLPIDASTIPTPPQLESDFVIVDVSDCVETTEENSPELIETLEADLTQQIDICTKNKEHFLRLGDVSSASKFEKLGLEARKDLSVIRHLKKTGGPTPKFHYETRLFSIVQCHADLADNDVEVTVERGINLPGKSDVLDSYVKLDFPIPSDAPQKAKTHTVRDTNNPIFQEEFKFEINRKSRAQLRQFKRQALKLEIWSKGGFLRSDTLLGTVSVKLIDLESKCTIHDCFDLMDGRKACGGKLEVKIRIRDPLLVKQVEEVREKWLVLGS